MADKDKKDAPASQSKRLEHSQGGVTTRDDALDSGVPMIQGDPSEPVGPEDALGVGQKRGDYRGVIGDRQFSKSVVNPDHDPDDPESPRYVLEGQNANVEDRGDAKGLKGGVETE